MLLCSNNVRRAAASSKPSSKSSSESELRRLKSDLSTDVVVSLDASSPSLCFLFYKKRIKYRINSISFKWNERINVKRVLVIAEIHDSRTATHRLWRRSGGVQNEFHVERCKAVSPTTCSLEVSYVFVFRLLERCCRLLPAAHKNNFNYVFSPKRPMYNYCMCKRLLLLALLLFLCHDVLARMLIVSHGTGRRWVSAPTLRMCLRMSLSEIVDKNQIKIHWLARKHATTHMHNINSIRHALKQFSIDRMAALVSRWETWHSACVRRVPCVMCRAQSMPRWRAGSSHIHI